MKDIIVDDFQNSVAESLVRHKSIIDLITKLSESTARVNRAVAKSVTTCGCISISARKQRIPGDATLEDIPNILTSQVDGNLCDNCREVLQEEIGTNFYYLAAICDALGLNLYDIILKEYDKVKTLGKFNMF